MRSLFLKRYVVKITKEECERHDNCFFILDKSPEKRFLIYVCSVFGGKWGMENKAQLMLFETSVM